MSHKRTDNTNMTPQGRPLLWVAEKKKKILAVCPDYSTNGQKRGVPRFADVGFFFFRTSNLNSSFLQFVISREVILEQCFTSNDSLPSSTAGHQPRNDQSQLPPWMCHFPHRKCQPNPCAWQWQQLSPLAFGAKSLVRPLGLRQRYHGIADWQTRCPHVNNLTELTLKTWCWAPKTLIYDWRVQSGVELPISRSWPRDQNHAKVCFLTFGSMSPSHTHKSRTLFHLSAQTQRKILVLTSQKGKFARHTNTVAPPSVASRKHKTRWSVHTGTIRAMTNQLQ